MECLVIADHDGVVAGRLNDPESPAGQPFGHRHKRQEELYVVVAGSGRARLDDEIVDIGPWDAIRVAPEVSRSFAAGPDGLEFLAVGAPAVESLPEDVEQQPSPWGQ